MELSGGARISFVLHETYTSAIKSFDPFDTVKDVDIRTIMYNSAVRRTELVVISSCRDRHLRFLSERLRLKSLSSSRLSVWKIRV